MPVHGNVCSTPRYMLMNGTTRMAPEVVRLPTGIECLPIYGFSDKARYEAFCSNSQLALVPYPLVPVFLRHQTQLAGDCLKLIIMDAAGPAEPYLNAATMKAVLAAHENSAPHVSAECRLTFDTQANAYRVEETAE